MLTTASGIKQLRSVAHSISQAALVLPREADIVSACEKQLAQVGVNGALCHVSAVAAIFFAD